MALFEMVMPKMGESIMEGTILRWLKKVGDRIEQDESVLEVATDKVDTEVPAVQAGYIMDILVKEGDVVPIGATIALISTTPLSSSQPVIPASQPKNNDESSNLSVSEEAGLGTNKADEVIPVNVEESVTTESHQLETQIETLINTTIVSKAEPQATEKVNPFKLSEPATGRFYSPLVLTIAREEGISMQELEFIPGTGGDNRVTKKDILNYVNFKKGILSEEEIPVTEVTKKSEPELSKSDINLEKTIDTSLEKPLTGEIVEIVKPTDKVLSIPLEKSTGNFISLDKPYSQSYEIKEEVSIPVEKVSEDIKTEELALVEDKKIEEELDAKKVEDEPATVQEVKYFKSEPDEPVESPALSVNGRVEIIEMDRMRKMIAQRMVESKRISPHVTSFVEADVTNIVYWRNKVKNEFKEREGDIITFTPIFIEAVVKALRDFPMINISVDGDKIIVKKDINIGMAVALPTGNLIVPVIHNADQLNLVGLTKKVNDLAKRARENKLKLEDLEGGTYTMSNIGTFGNVMGTPIIMQPQVAIMSFGAVQKKPAVIETPYGDTLGIRQLMFLSHSYDHRVIDGALGGMFVRRVADYLENFDVNRKVF
jgi:2-oxoglutarate dehydrogenase E2 component (dihydrolipoamide succinyltransferase)